MTCTEDSHRTKGLLRLTMACNERCPFCNVPVERYRRPTPPQEEVQAELQRFLDAEEQTLTISGGEPTLLRKRLLALVAQARAGGISQVELQTNAVLIDDAFAQALAAAGLTSAFVSLLSDAPELHDTLAGLPGAWPRCLAGIDALLEAGVAVTLNPVIARQTEGRLVAYVRFVAERLPRVKTISLSAVQPHGRAAADPSLMPDYAVLAGQVPAARRAAAGAGITLVNPYCGLPLCIGWRDDLERCVEAAEAQDGGWRWRPGVDNQGDKSHGEPCRRCALQPWCGGAWHAYWTARSGAGIAPPAEVVPPWRAGAAAAELQTVVRAPGGLNEAAHAALDAATTPTIWLWTDALRSGDLAPLLTSRCTDLGLEVAAGLVAGQARPRWLRPLRRLLRTGRVRVHLAARRPLPPEDQAALLALAERLGVIGVDLLPPRIPR